MPLTSRRATEEDIPALVSLMDRAITQNQMGFLVADQITSSKTIMGLDSQLVADGTYFVVENEGAIVGCGGWSRRATLYGGNETPGRDVSLLDPAVDPARVRAMYTDPDFTRRGVGRLVLGLCEQAAGAEGFTQLELVATLSASRSTSTTGSRPWSTSRTAEAASRSP